MLLKLRDILCLLVAGHIYQFKTMELPLLQHELAPLQPMTAANKCSDV